MLTYFRDCSSDLDSNSGSCSHVFVKETPELMEPKSGFGGSKLGHWFGHVFPTIDFEDDDSEPQPPMNRNIEGNDTDPKENFPSISSGSYCCVWTKPLSGHTLDLQEKRPSRTIQ